MLRGRVQMGTHQQTRDRWINDKLDDCSQDDQIWGWSIRSSEILDQDKTLIDDDVLRVMLYQGLLDAKPGAPAWTEPLSLRQGLRLMSNISVRLLQRHFKTDIKVFLIASCRSCKC